REQMLRMALTELSEGCLQESFDHIESAQVHTLVEPERVVTCGPSTEDGPNVLRWYLLKKLPELLRCPELLAYVRVLVVFEGSSVGNQPDGRNITTVSLLESANMNQQWRWLLVIVGARRLLLDTRSQS